MGSNPQWGKGIFSKELAQFRLQDAIGHTIVCDDGIPRRVVEIVGSVKFPWKCIINEQDPDSKAGHFVCTLSLTDQILRHRVPPKFEIDAFERMMRIEVSKFGFPDPEPKKSGLIV